MEWNKIDFHICNSASRNVFKEVILKLIRPEPSQVDSSGGLKFLTRIRLGLSYVADYKFRYTFQDRTNPVCCCGQEIKISTHFLLHRFNYHCAKQTFFENIKKLIQQS